MVEPQRENDKSSHQLVNGYIKCSVFIEQNIIQQ